MSDEFFELVGTELKQDKCRKGFPTEECPVRKLLKYGIGIKGYTRLTNHSVHCDRCRVWVTIK